MEVKIAITKFFIAAVILWFIFHLSEKDADNSDFFARQKWTLKDAYNAVTMVMCAIFLLTVYISLWIGPLPPSSARMAWGIICILIFGSYNTAVGKPYGVKLVDLGMDKAHFLGSGVFALNLAGGYFLLSAAGIKIPSLGAVAAASPPVTSTVDAALYGIVFAFCEELLFRGVLYAPVARGVGVGTAIVGLALVECLIHVRLDVEQSIVMFVVFAAFYLIYAGTESLLGPVILHIGINLPLWLPVAMDSATGFLPASTVNFLFIGIPLLTLLIVDVGWLLNDPPGGSPILPERVASDAEGSHGIDGST